MKRNLILTYFVLTLVILIPACAPTAPENTSAPEPTATTLLSTPIPQPTDTPAAPQLSFEPQTYRDESAGIQLQYPSDWTLNSNTEVGSRGAQSVLLSPGSTVETLAEGGAMLAITTYIWEPKNDLEAYIVRRKTAWESSGFTILSEKERTLSDGRKAVEFLIQTPDVQGYSLMTTIGDDYLELSGQGNLDLVEEIAHTLAPMQ